MSKCTTEVALRGILSFVVVIALQAAAVAQSSTRLATFDNAGETYFALSVKAEPTSESRASDVVICVDTSASQTGPFKRDSIATVKQILRNLSGDDRVKIVAVDIDPVVLTQNFVSVTDADVEAAMTTLRDRVALGTTDLEAMLQQAATEFPTESTRNKNVIYIGDGISADGLLQTPAFQTVVEGLVKNQVSVSSFAIGPVRNVEIMAALANHTGGNVLVDSGTENVISNAASTLAQTVHGSVFWPTDVKAGKTIVEMYPTNFPPLRSDRDSVIMGTIADAQGAEFTLTGDVDGKSQSIKLQATPEASSNEFAFLPGMIREARDDSGLRLPTLGSAGLREFAAVRKKKSMQLSNLASQAINAGDIMAAERLGQGAVKNSDDPVATREALKSMADPKYIAKAAPKYIIQDSIFDAPGPVEVEAPSPFDITPIPATPELNPIPNEQRSPEASEPLMAPKNVQEDGIFLQGPDDQNDEIQQLLRSRAPGAVDAVKSVDELQRITNEKYQTLVRVEIQNANRELNTNPDFAIERLKTSLETVRLAPELFPSVRGSLIARLESSLQSARRQKFEFDERSARALQNEAFALETAENARRRDRREDRLTNLIDLFEDRLAEEQYNDAVAVTEEALRIAPNEPAVTAAAAYARIARNVDKIQKLKRVKQDAVVTSLYDVQVAATPYPGNTLMVFPDADEWREKQLRRAKFQDFRLSGSEAEEKVLSALELPADFNWEEQGWNEVKEELENKYGINIVLTTSASDDALTEDETFSSKLSGISLKNALRIELSKKNATFVVKDEVLQIISLDEANDEKWFVTNVFNVADLVAPRQNRTGGGQGAFGGSGVTSGGGGGFGGGGGGGFGGGGGGGIGGGGGFGGGAFCIQNVAADISVPAKTQRSSKRQSEPVNLSGEGKPVVAWKELFSTQFVDPADVRATVRKLAKEDQPKEVVAVIMAAIDNNQLQGWMYEALAMAMQDAGESQNQIERALLSAVDLSGDSEDILLTANYMAVNGMEVRAMKLYRGFARANPTRYEPFVLGLRTAKQINDIDGQMWATVGIFGQEWPDHKEVVENARYVAKGIQNTLTAEGKTEQLAKYKQQIAEAQERDCLIQVRWTGDADLDLLVFEPGGTICSRLKKRTSSGGIMLGDRFSPSKNYSGEIVETYVLPKGFAGDYQLVINRVWGDVTFGKATVSITNHYLSDKQQGLTRQVKLDKTGAIVRFALDRGRRTENLADHEIQNFVREQLTTNRNTLMAQLAKNRSSSAASEFFGGQFTVDGQTTTGLTLGTNRVVGNQPVIQNFNEGASLNTSASTADRLFVIVAPSPFFTQITEVATFNILGTADSAQGIVDDVTGDGT